MKYLHLIRQQRYDRCADQLFFLSLLFLLMNTTLPALAENRIALVVGNASYRNIPRLANPASDARLMASTLMSLGFRLVGGGAQIDLDKAALDRAVRTFGSELQGADVGLFYYAGHGLQVRGANYLVPIGANPIREADVDFELEDLTLVLRQMEASGTRLNLVMLDACRNNPFGGRGLRAVDSGLAQLRAPEGTLISFATQPGNVARDGDNGHSPYSRALAQTILQPGIGVFDVMNQVGLTVKKATGGEQQPWVSSSPIDGSFYFAGTARAEERDPSQAIRKTDIQSPSKPDAVLQRAEAPNAVAAMQDDTVEGRPNAAKISEIAMVAPVQAAPPAQYEGGKADRGVAIYDGKWLGSLTGNCPHVSNGTVVFDKGYIRGTVFGAKGSGRVSADGTVSAHFQAIGLIHGTVTGRMTSSTSGSGTWRDELGCSGGWTLSR
jgi:Caspase domain